MVKKVEFLRNSGWQPFPGSGGSFTAETAEIDDTILGQSFQSNDRGLIDWKVSTDAVLKGYPGYTCRISRTRVAGRMVTEAMVTVSQDTIIERLGTATGITAKQVTDRSKRLWLRPEQFDQPFWDEAPTGVSQPPTADAAAISVAYSGTAVPVKYIDYLDGTIYFDGDVDAQSITVTGYYLSIEPLVRASDYTLNMQVTMKDETNFTESSSVVVGKAVLSGATNGGITGAGITEDHILNVFSRDGYNVTTLDVTATGAGATVAAAAAGNTLTVRLASAAATNTPANVAAAINAAFKSKGGIPGKFYARVGADMPATARVGAFGPSTLATAKTFTGAAGYPAPSKVDEPDARGDGAGGYMLYSPGLRTFNLSISGVEVPGRVLPSGLDYHKALRDRRELLVEINPDGRRVTRSGDGVDYPATSGVGFVGWFRLGSTGNEGDVGQTQTSTIEFTLAVPQATSVNKVLTPVQIVGARTRLMGTVQDCFNSWNLAESENEVRFTPDDAIVDLTGANVGGGAIQGKCVISNFTLTGSLTDMNKFEVELMGNGRYVEVGETFNTSGQPITRVG